MPCPPSLEASCVPHPSCVPILASSAASLACLSPRLAKKSMAPIMASNSPIGTAMYLGSLPVAYTTHTQPSTSHTDFYAYRDMRACGLPNS